MLGTNLLWIMEYYKQLLSFILSNIDKDYHVRLHAFHFQNFMLQLWQLDNQCMCSKVFDNVIKKGYIGLMGDWE